MSHLSLITKGKVRVFHRTGDGTLVECRDDAAPIIDEPSANEAASRRLGIAICIFVALSTIMFIAQFVRAYLAGLL